MLPQMRKGVQIKEFKEFEKFKELQNVRRRALDCVANQNIGTFIPDRLE
jgi:hypothetical protein